MDSALARIMGAQVPPKTDSYTPIPHNQVIQNTLAAIKSKGFELKSQIYRSSVDGMIAQGEYHIHYGSDKEMGLMIAWQNSYNKQISFKYAIGAHVFVCSNGCVAGDMGSFRRKHTGDADVEAVMTIENYLTNAGKMFDDLVRDREKLKTIQLNPREVAEIIGRMYVEHEIITSTQVNIMKREVHNPSFDYGAKDTAWELYNHATYSFKEDSPRNWISRHVDLHNFFDLQFGLSYPLPAVIVTDKVQTEINFSEKLLALDEPDFSVAVEEKIENKEVKSSDILDWF